MPEAGARRHDDPHDADRGAARHRRQTAVRDAADALRQGDRRQDRARIRGRQARRARGPRPARGRVALSRRTQRERGQGRPARSQHVVLDREIRLSGPPCARAGHGRPLLPARVRAVPAMRGIPVVGALPAAFSRRPSRGAAQLRRAAADRPPARLFDARRPGRRRALHEALFSRGEGRGRPDGDRLRRARGAADQADPGVRPVHRAPEAEHPRDRRHKGLQGRERSHQHHPRRRLRARSGESDPPVLDRRPFEPAHSPGCDETGHAVAEARRRRLAGESRGQPAFPRDPDLQAFAGDGAQAHERGRRARPLHSRFRPGRRHDAVLDVSSLYDRRAPAADRRRAQRDRGGSPQGGLSPRRARSSTRSPIAPNSISRPFCTTSPRAGRPTIRRRAPRSRASSVRGLASRRPTPNASPGSSSSI